MHSFISEIKKSLQLPLFILSCIGVVLSCCFSEGYVSAGGKTYTNIELLLLLPKEIMLTDISLNRYDIWIHGIGMWTQLLLPFLLSIGYLYTISSEKQTGFHRFLLVRQTNFRYCVSKMLAVIVSGGIVLLAGNLIFGILVYARFPSVYEYSADKLAVYMEMNPNFHEIVFLFQHCIGVLLYGMCMNVFAYLVSVFFVDKYILVCLPIMLKYIWGQVVMKIEIDAMNLGQDNILNFCAGLRIETVLNINQSANWGMTLLLITSMYTCGLCLMFHFLKKRGEGLGLE